MGRWPSKLADQPHRAGPHAVALRQQRNVPFFVPVPYLDVMAEGVLV